MSYLSPHTLRLSRRRPQLQPTRLNDRPHFGFADAAIDRAFATSKDGTGCR